jgi:hypothetical protein
VDLQQQIRSFNWADQHLFRALNNTLFERIKRSIGFEKELAWLQAEKVRYHELCKQFIGWGDDKHRKLLLEGEPDEEEEMCHLLMLDSPGFVKLLKVFFGQLCQFCQLLPQREIYDGLMFGSLCRRSGGEKIQNVTRKVSNVEP